MLRAWAAPLEAQLATLPGHLHPAALAADDPSIDASCAVSLCELPSRPFRAALRSAAALTSMSRINAVTFTPSTCMESKHPDNGRRASHRSCHECLRGGPPCTCDSAATALDAQLCSLRFAARHLSALTSLTALHLHRSTPTVNWLNDPDSLIHGLACVTSMPHLRALGLEHIEQPLLATAIRCLTHMPGLRELHLTVCSVPLLARADDSWQWGGAELLCQLTALTTLEAVKLKLHYLFTEKLEDGGVTTVFAPLLRDLDSDDKLKSARLMQRYFAFDGARRPDAVWRVLGALRDAAPKLDAERCTIEEHGSGEVSWLGPTALEELWRALMVGSEGTVRCIGMSCDSVRPGSAPYGTIELPPALLAEAAGLRHLTLSAAPDHGRRTAAALGRELHRFTRLESLAFCKDALDRSAAQALLPRLSDVTSLRLLDLEEACIGPAGGAALAAVLPSLGTLMSLQLTQNDLGESGGVAVVTALAPSAVAGLKRLQLGWNRIGPTGFAAVAARLPDMTSLRELDLCASLAGAEGMHALSQGLVERGVLLTALEQLILDRNFLECGGAQELARTLPVLPNLHVLSVQANAIGHVGMRALARRIVPMARLSSVEMDYNCIGDVGAQALAREVRRSGDHAMAIDSCPVEQPGVRHDVDRTHDVSRVSVTYELTHNAIGDAGALALAAALFSRRGGRAEKLTMCLQANHISGRVWNDIAKRSKQWQRAGMSCLLCQECYCGGTDDGLQAVIHALDA